MKLDNKKENILVCVWKPNDTWNNLTEQEKRFFLSNVAASATAAQSEGMKILGWGLLERGISNPPLQSFCGVFLVDDRESLFVVDNAIRESGWYQYFDHINIASSLVGQDGLQAEQALYDLLGVS